MDKEEYYKRIEKINNRFKTDRVSADEEYHLVCQKNYLSTKYIEHLEQQCKKQKKAIDKAIKYTDYNIKYRNGADIYQFVDIESEILEPLKFILELDEENGNAYLKEFNDWLKEVSE